MWLSAGTFWDNLYGLQQHIKWIQFVRTFLSLQILPHLSKQQIYFNNQASYPCAKTSNHTFLDHCLTNLGSTEVLVLYIFEYKAHWNARHQTLISPCSKKIIQSDVMRFYHLPIINSSWPVLLREVVFVFVYWCVHACPVFSKNPPGSGNSSPQTLTYRHLHFTHLDL